MFKNAYFKIFQNFEQYTLYTVTPFGGGVVNEGLYQIIYQLIHEACVNICVLTCLWFFKEWFIYQEEVLHYTKHDNMSHKP